MKNSLLFPRALPPREPAESQRTIGQHLALHWGLVVIATIGAIPYAVHAQTTFDFSAGWTGTGANVTYQTTPYTTTSKGTPFTLTPPTGSGMYRLFPVSNAVNGASAADTALGLTQGTVDSLLNHNPNFAGSVTNFSILSQTMMLNAGTYSFAWALNVTDPGFNDGALVSIVGNGFQYIESLARAGGPGDTSGPSPHTYIAYNYGPASGVTPWITTTVNIATTGAYKISFANYNWKDLAVPPNFFVTSTPGTYTGNPLAGNSGGPPTEASSTSIPTLGAWGLILLSSLMAVFGIVGVRRGR
ncbi:IPTL-CTERM sorting domain-containing protein [Paracidovorax cattleyae]|uniref:IPTL-CTERM protein sorting domain-containing protein n=1 Tax=Paracidovorax cattleyae TaxID=80868 RepID=A0A1H0WXG5_9BURK|nr:IPTL-CTERM sorting domain-containing protein [Paracidovorax cattleyae]MBF9265328.1 IPTL-CTERM sorting domain-containing protein [Paracidovorax cattleyae]SDP95377.1 IPTL-CTERM protein sorting domain-containing protein [Paracidovorax cattleyae]